MSIPIWFRSRRRGGNGFNEVDRDILYHLLERMTEMTDSLSRLHDDVAQQTTLINSVVTLLNGIAQRVRDANNNGDEEELAAIANELEVNSATLAQAVASASAAQPIDSGTASQSGTATLGDGSTGQPTPDQQGTTDQPTAQPDTGTDTTTGQ